MAVGVSILVFVIGAFLRFATTVYSSSLFNIHALGLVLMVGGAIGLLVSAWDLALGGSPLRSDVKPSAYLPQWLPKLSRSLSGPTRKARAGSNQRGHWQGRQRHHSNLYVFALPSHAAREEAHTPDPLDERQWRFFVVPTWKIDRRDRKTISEPMLTSMAQEVHYTELPEAVRRAAEPDKAGQKQ